MGTFEFAEFSLAPRGFVEEPSRGGFELKESWIGFSWKRDQGLGGEIAVGTPDLVSPSVFYPTSDRDIALTKAFVYGRTKYLDVQAGLVQVPVGYEGSVPEWELFLPSTHVRKNGWFTKRDYGLQLIARKGSFYTNLTVHNGESGPNEDQKVWYSGLWRVQTNEGYGLLMTGTTGRTDERSTTGATAAGNAGFSFDPLKASKMRHSTIAIYRKWMRHLALVEYAQGDIIQDDRKKSFDWGHVDISANFGGDLNGLVRYEQSQANKEDRATQIKSYGLGFSLSSKDRLSQVTFWMNKHQEEAKVNNDEALLIFRINSNYL